MVVVSGVPHEPPTAAGRAGYEFLGVGARRLLHDVVALVVFVPTALFVFAFFVVGFREGGWSLVVLLRLRVSRQKERK